MPRVWNALFTSGDETTSAGFWRMWDDQTIFHDAQPVPVT